ncbi:hydroxymethylpyrimidine/phosphomethylpyrimidine kinase [Betaproteobacteria bacterium]|nr:hydroxymethylpyrimidine/phosphomethylpyrimidine kinase [Betaproteobacteria bacterium]GHU42764.1 hydroxymethylpyrimidine/phosphomethylpyrimidine kinase [Betaproteobacteria bacterium]
MYSSSFHPQPPLSTVLVFAASDPVSGAGVQADLLTLAALGCHPATVITALTVQDTVGVASVHPVAADLVERQARAVLADMPVAAFKVGVLGSVDNARAVAAIAADYPRLPLILDPVLASGRGDAFADDALMAALCEHLMPHTTLLTPNMPEARRLTAGIGTPDDTQDQIAAHLLSFGVQYVLLTGGHEIGESVCNRLYAASGLLREDCWQRLPGEFHGSGCTLASACAAYLAQGQDITHAVRAAQNYTWQSLAHAFRPGQGQSIPNRMFQHG